MTDYISRQKVIDAENLIKKLDNRIDAYTAKYPEKKDGIEVQSVRELIHVIELEVQDES